MKKTYTKKQIAEAIQFWQKKLDEASYGGERGISDPNLEQPSQEELSRQLVGADDEYVADLLIRTLSEINLRNPVLKGMLLNLEDPAMLADFTRTLIGSMNPEQYKMFVKSQF